VVAAELEAGGVTALFVLAASGEPDEHAFNQITKKTITASPPRATVFHQSRGSLLYSVSIVLLLFLQLPGRRIPLTAEASGAFHLSLFRISPHRNGPLRETLFSELTGSLPAQW
jgi:hypothetical protein